MKEKKIIAKMFHYVNGNELKLIVWEFDRVEDAIEAGIKAACHSFKVYDRNGELCHDSEDEHGHRHHHHHPYA